MKLLHEKTEEYSSFLLAGLYLLCHAINTVTMTWVWRLLGLKKAQLRLKHAEIYLVATTLGIIFLVAAYQRWPQIGWVVVVFACLRIIQIMSLNLMTLLFDSSPTGGADAVLKRARWHFLALAFSITDVVIGFGAIYQILDQKYQILNQHFDHVFEYLYFSLIAFSTVGFGEIYPANLLGKGVVCFQVVTFIFMLIFFVSGVGNRFGKHA